MKKVPILFVVLFSIFLLPHNIFAYDASGLLGQNQNGTPIYISNNIGGGANSHGLHGPTDVVIDSVNHRLFVADTYNNRVLVFNLDSSNNVASTTATYVFGQNNFTSGASSTTQSGLNNPTGLAYDSSSGRLFVADGGGQGSNNRVLVFDASVSTLSSAPLGEDAEYVFGQSDYTSSATMYGNKGKALALMSYPTGLAYDSSSGRLFVSDGGYNRVLVFDASVSTLSSAPLGEGAEYVFGQPDFSVHQFNGITKNGFSTPSGITYDPSSGRLFVADTGDNRVLVFDASTATLSTAPLGEDPEYVFGQTDFLSNNTNYLSTPNSFYGPTGLSFEPSSGRLFVADQNFNRVLVFDASTTTLNAAISAGTYGEDAEYVFGQTSFVSTNQDYTETQKGLRDPFGLTYDPSSGRLFVADGSFNRLMVFDASTTTLNAAISAGTYGVNAVGDLGQTDANGNLSYTKVSIDGGPYAHGLYLPSNVEIDTINHRLFVADTSNNRVLVFNLDSTNNISSSTASYVFGQPDFTTGTFYFSATKNDLSGPTGLAFDSSSNRLFVVDSGNNRVLVFDASPTTLATAPLGEDAEYVFGQPDFTSNSSGIAKNRLSWSINSITYDSTSGRLFVADASNNRVLVFDASTTTLATALLGEDAEYVFGQPDFTSNVFSYGTITKSGFSYNMAGLAYDPSGGRLFVGDSSNNRVLVFDASPTTLTTAPLGEDAEYVFGQPDFTSNNGSFTQQGSLNFPSGLIYDSSSDRLFVVDTNDSRILIFDASPTTLTTAPLDEDAQSVIGQPDFTSNSSATTQSGLNLPKGAIFDSSMNRLFVADTYNNRIMEFSFVRAIDPELPAGNVGSPYSYTIDTTSYQGTVSFSLLSGSLPDGLSFDSSTGVISGTPTKAGDNTFSIEIIDNLAAEGTLSDLFVYTLAINSASTPPTPTSSSGGVGGITTSGNYVCKIGDKFNPATGLPCSNYQPPKTTSCSVVITLKIGNKGPQVKCLQNILKITSDGSFGLKTKSAVIALQKANKLKTDGVVGTATRKVVNGMSK